MIEHELYLAASSGVRRAIKSNRRKVEGGVKYWQRASRRYEHPSALRRPTGVRVAGERDRAAQGQAYRQRTGHHSHRAVEGPQGPQCDAFERDARSVATMVEGASLAMRRRSTAAGTLAVSQQKVCWQADHHPSSQPLIP